MRATSLPLPMPPPPPPPQHRGVAGPSAPIAPDQTALLSASAASANMFLIPPQHRGYNPSASATFVGDVSQLPNRMFSAPVVIEVAPPSALCIPAVAIPFTENGAVHTPQPGHSHPSVNEVPLGNDNGPCNCGAIHIKKLRVKKGLGHFLCLQCGHKWRNVLRLPMEALLAFDHSFASGSY